MIAASKDPNSGNLDRVQVIKGWVDAAGKSHDRIYDVVWSGNRKIGADGKLPAVGNSVDVKNASYTNTIGSPELATVWKDPDFDPAVPAFYYVGCSRFRRRAGRPTTPRRSASSRRRTSRRRSRNAPGPVRSGTRRAMTIT